MDLELQNKCALVTGSSRGLGYATALTLAKEGATVAINSRHAEGIRAAAQTLAADTGADIFPFVGDVTDPKACEGLVAEAAEKMGGLDLLVTNAGGPPSGSFESFDEGTWQTALEMSFLNHVRLIRAALPRLRESECASVLTITSFSVKQPVPNLVLSNSIRAATVGLTKTLALELGHEGIRFNSILPGWTETERIQDLMAFRAQKSGTSVEVETQKQAAASPFGRMARPEEFSNAAVFLLSPKASYITGVMLTIDGGMYLGTL